MRIFKQALSILLSVLLVAPLDGCKKQAGSSNLVETANAQTPPATTYATPTPDQLYQLVAPIALFPDNLLAQVLAASTFPDQVTAAYQWVGQNSALKGQQLTQAVDQQPWDVSVKGLTQFPDVLQQMATNLSWTSSLGDAYFNIPQSVMNAVQVMRQRAQQAGNLKSDQHQNISMQQTPPAAPPAQASSGQPQTTVVQAPPQTIVIQPSQPEVVYVPTYNPTAVYGAPVAPYPGYSSGDMVAASLLSFGVGIAVGAAMNSGGCCGWGWNSWGCGWNNSTVVYNHNTYISNSNTFVNRNNYARNANYNNVNRNINNSNINRNNINANNINRNNINRNNVNPNNRANNFSTPNFNQNRNQTQFRNENASNLAQQRGGTPNFDQQNRAGSNVGQSRPGAANTNQRNMPNQGNLGQQRGGTPNFNQQNRAAVSQQPAQRQPQRGYGDQAANRDAGNGAFSNYGQGGNARTNSARGQQSLEGGAGRAAGGGGGRMPEGGGGGRAAGGRGRR